MQGTIFPWQSHVCMRLITGVSFSFPRRRTLITWRPAARDYPSCCQSDRLAWDLFRGRTGEKWCWREIQFPWQRLKKMLNCYFHFSTGERKSCSSSTWEKRKMERIYLLPPSRSYKLLFRKRWMWKLAERKCLFLLGADFCWMFKMDTDF